MVVVVDQRPLGQFITQLKSKLLAESIGAPCQNLCFARTKVFLKIWQ